ncbi:MAG: hypothetical protein LBB88_10180 [Planctomycetaceae bacterium]|jgi:hypothetical protein|nr:hypothetical protein [Planctomycetaceae bacterium]
MNNLFPTWNPTIIKRVEKSDIESSTSPFLVVTDRGKGYFKVLGNNEGPRVLACEYVGTSLAKLLGLSTFEYCLFNFSGQPEIEFSNGYKAESGYGFLSKAESGNTWDGTQLMLETIINKEDITKLVCLDTLVRNKDRYFPRSNNNVKSRRNYDNVFLSKQSKKKTILKAFDFTHAFNCGRDFTINYVKDESIFGLFPEFKNYFNLDVATEFCTKLKTIDKQSISSIVEKIPSEWDIKHSDSVRWIDFILCRAEFVSANFIRLSRLRNCSQQLLLDFEKV